MGDIDEQAHQSGGAACVISSDVMAELAPEGALRVGIAVGETRLALWAAKDPGRGRPTGATVSLGLAMGKALGVPTSLVAYLSSGKIIEAADSGECTVSFAGLVATGLSQTPEQVADWPRTG